MGSGRGKSRRAQLTLRRRTLVEAEKLAPEWFAGEFPVDEKYATQVLYATNTEHPWTCEPVPPASSLSFVLQLAIRQANADLAYLGLAPLRDERIVLVPPQREKVLELDRKGLRREHYRNQGRMRTDRERDELSLEVHSDWFYSAPPEDAIGMLQRISDLQLDPSTFGEKDIETAMAFRRFKGVARTIAHEMFHLRLKEASGEGERDVQRREARAQRKAESDAAWQQKKDDGELSLREGWRMIQNERQKIQGERKELEGEIVSMNASYTCEEGFARFVGAWAQGNINNSYTAVEAELKEGRWRSYEDLVSKGRYEDGHYLALALWHLPGTEADFKDFAGDFLRRVESARDQQGPRLNLFTVLEEELRARRRADFSLADYYSRFYAQAVKAVRADQEAAYERLVLDGFLPLQS